MTEAEARKAIEQGYFSSANALETEEILGLISRWFPEVYRNQGEDQDLESLVCSVLYG